MRPEHKSSYVSHGIPHGQNFSDIHPGNALAIEIPTKVASKALKLVFVYPLILNSCLPLPQHLEASYRRQWSQSPVSTASATYGHKFTSSRQVPRTLWNHRPIIPDHLPAAPVFFSPYNIRHFHFDEAVCWWKA